MRSILFIAWQDVRAAEDGAALARDASFALSRLAWLERVEPEIREAALITAPGTSRGSATAQFSADSGMPRAFTQDELFNAPVSSPSVQLAICTDSAGASASAASK